eukprot:jgi/Mesen1/5459/ME000273S04699
MATLTVSFENKILNYCSVNSHSHSAERKRCIQVFTCAPSRAALQGSRHRLSSSAAITNNSPFVYKTERVHRISKPMAVRADSNGDSEDEVCTFSGTDFYKVEAILRPWRLKYVAAALLRMGIRGVTVSDVRGFGAQGGSRERQAGSEFTDDNFVSKSKIEIVVIADQVEAVVDTIIEEARTGEIGDGKIFISPVTDIIRVRTGERGMKAERMAGGRMEILSANGK